MSPTDQCRLQFIRTLYSLPERGRVHLLGMESDAELEDLKRVTLDAQHFEMAVVVANEIKRRKTGIPVK